MFTIKRLSVFAFKCNFPAIAWQVRSELSNDTRRKVNTLIITDVHGRDIIDKFVRDSIMDAREFAWESQLRFYWEKAVVRLKRFRYLDFRPQSFYVHL